MNKLRKRYWPFPVVLALAAIGAYAFVSRDVGQAPPTAEGGIDGTDAGLAAYFDKTCVQLRDLNWALARLRQNVDSCGWAGNSDCEENQALAGVEWLARIRQGGVARVTFGRQIARDGNW
ncbi:hypothetical protein [Silvimonas sp.]|uniref:hypothetical protein n=1 Tax=Silvimonas sp. TaxID=2650811 RepID=UPI00284F943C|nr:hypothetical protein [Silvimonas sp.]MDR3428100.1 hypothetical protein [Silvimonas sp.]